MSQDTIHDETVRRLQQSVSAMKRFILLITVLAFVFLFGGAANSINSGLLKRVDVLEGSGVVLIGSMIPYMGDTVPANSGWLLCDGSPIPSGEVYDELRRILGNHVPDMRGRTAYGQSKETPFKRPIGNSHVYLKDDHMPFGPLMLTDQNQYGLHKGSDYGGRVVISQSNPFGGGPKTLDRTPKSSLPTLSPGIGVNWVIRYGPASP